MLVDPKEFRAALAEVNGANDQVLALLRDQYALLREVKDYSDEEIQQFAVDDPTTIRGAFAILSSLALSARAEQMLAQHEMET